MLKYSKVTDRHIPIKVRGTVEGGNPKISIRFDWDTFNAIAAKAEKTGVTFSTVVRQCVAKAMRD